MNDDVRLAMRGLHALMPRSELVDIASQLPRVRAYRCDPYMLMRSMSVFRGQTQKLVFLDMPRAAKRLKANLVDDDEERGAVWSDVACEDLGYRLRLKANCLICARLALDCLSYDGLLLAVATPDTYMAVRGAVEHWMGPDKFIGEIVYQVRRGGGNDSDTLSIEHETLLIFCRSPESLPGIKIMKSAQELKKYSEKDDLGFYCWDTYIRKQARQYYRIQCPDGSFLEKDEDGMPISWLWNKETFMRKLEAGEVKFEKVSGKGWRLYYKDRIKSEKVVRSVARPEYCLDDIVEGAEKTKAEEVFLTQKGTQEIDGYSGSRPEYLKSSKYYGFLIDTFSRGGDVFIPFNENGSAVIAGLAESRKMNRLVVGGVSFEDDYIKWRISKSGVDGHDFSYSIGDKVDLLGVVQEDSPATIRIIKSMCVDVLSWHDLGAKSALLHVGLGQDTVVLVEKLLDEKSSFDLIKLLNEHNLLRGRLKQVCSVYSESVIRGLVVLPDNVRVEQFPMNLLK